MAVIFHAHHAVISERMRDRALRAIDKLRRRLPRLVTAIVRFEQDGPSRRVEVTLQAPRRRDLVAEGRARTYGPALAEAVRRLSAQLDSVRRPRRARARARTLASA